MQLAEARNLRALRAYGDVELTLDARYASHNEWLETEIEVAADDPIEIKANGRCCSSRRRGNGFESNPNGNVELSRRQSQSRPVARPSRQVRSDVHRRRTLQGLAGRNPAGFIYGQSHPSPWGNQMTGSYGIKVILGGGGEGRTPITPKSELKDVPKIDLPK